MITVYSTPNCVNCNSLKSLFKANQIDFEEKIIGKDILKEEIEELAGVELRAAPVIFKDTRYVGGIAEGMLLINEERELKTAKLQEQMLAELKAAGVDL